MRSGVGRGLLVGDGAPSGRAGQGRAAGQPSPLPPGSGGSPRAPPGSSHGLGGATSPPRWQLSRGPRGCAAPRRARWSAGPSRAGAGPVGRASLGIPCRGLAAASRCRRRLCRVAAAVVLASSRLPFYSLRLLRQGLCSLKRSD